MAFDGIKRLFSDDDDYEEEYQEVQEREDKPARKERKGMVSMTAYQQQPAAKEAPGRIALFEPKVYADSRAIASQVIDGDPVLVNFSQLEEDQAMRILDYIGGAVYAVSGSMERVGEKIFLLTPAGYEVVGSMSDNLDNQSRY
ncbi:cell division protein SepF [Leuconostocaceae bacterium ESL0958]|nr:cell division protein SepF [Leuconostocaceae bacterium ESL0958]